MVKKGARRKQISANIGARHATVKIPQTAIGGEQRVSSNTTQKSIPKVKVAGAQRVWGTYWSSSPKAVSNTTGNSVE